VDPAERLTAAAALEQLPGKDKVTYPTAGALLDVSLLASQGGADAAEGGGVGSPRKRTKGTKVRGHGLCSQPVSTGRSWPSPSPDPPQPADPNP